MKNIKATINGTKLTLEVDLSQENGVSKSGKSISIASTEGNIPLPGAEDIKIGLNIYKPKN